ncbi:MAG TPA: efflux RND transporter periplasmic adaptor subunit [Hyphomonadaceae bacterium]|nr:efflux RND transporter periplasmic adaptor subunit [Hyphomonadaceae bacterium]
MKLTKRDKIVGAAAVAVLAVGGIAFATMGGGGATKSETAGGHGPAQGGPGAGGPGGGRGPGGGGMVTQVAAVEATPKTFNVKIEALGTLEPRERVVLTANAADRVTGVFFEDGQRVTKGKVLMTLVNDQENSELDAARATLSNAKLVFERNQRLAKNDAIAQLELERTRSAYDAAVANVGAVQARLRDRITTAPFSGVLGFRQVSTGAYVSPGQVVATLIDDSQMRLEFGVPSIYVSDLKGGLPISATTKDVVGRTFTGTLTSIDNAIDPTTLAVKVRATLPNKDGVLRAGTSMTVTLSSQPRTSLSIPEISVIAEGSKTFVYVVDSTRQPAVVAKTELTLGTRERGSVEVINGLKSGDLVVTDGVLKVRPGGAVRVTGATPVGEGGAAKIASGNGMSSKADLKQ